MDKTNSPTRERTILAWNFHSWFEMFPLEITISGLVFQWPERGSDREKKISIENFILCWKLDFFDLASRDCIFSILGPSGQWLGVSLFLTWGASWDKALPHKLLRVRAMHYANCCCERLAMICRMWHSPHASRRWAKRRRRGSSNTNFRGWRGVWGEPGENRGRPKEPGENRGHLGRKPGENRAFGIHLQRVPGENRGEGIFFETRDPTRDLKINEQDRPWKLVSSKPNVFRPCLERTKIANRLSKALFETPRGKRSHRARNPLDGGNSALVIGF